MTHVTIKNSRTARMTGYPAADSEPVEIDHYRFTAGVMQNIAYTRIS